MRLILSGSISFLVLRLLRSDLNVYSYFSAETGTSVAALSEGYKPDIKPTMVAKTIAKMGSQKGVTVASIVFPI